MNESILTTIKKMLGMSNDYTDFDADIITGINSAFGKLQHIGIGPSIGFLLTDASSTWSMFVTDVNEFNKVKMYVYLSTRLIFDPPANSFVVDSLTKERDELFWRLSIDYEEKRRMNR